MNSRDTIKLPDSKLSLRVRLWKDKAGTELAPTMSSHGDGWVYKASLSSPTWIKTIAVDLEDDEILPKEFVIEVSDYGAYSLLASTCSQGSSSCVVASIVGFEVGRDIIFRGDGETAKFTITEVDTGTNTITFNGFTPVEFSTGNYSTVEDDRWYKVVDSVTNVATIITFGEITDTEPMIAFYGQYIRVAPVRQESIIRLTTLTLYEDDYFDLTAYLEGGLSYEQSVDIVEASTQLPNVSLKFLNIDDNFNRRNTSSIYIESGINYVNTPKRITIEWLAHESDWKQALNTDDEPDWVLECSFTSRRWSISRDEHSIATVSGETLNRVSKPIDIPMLEVMNVESIIEDWILMQRHRQNLLESDGDKTKFRLAVLEDNAISRTHTTYNETIGRGTFGRPVALFSDPADKQPSLIYAGHFGLACDGNYLYSSHTLQAYDGIYNHGMVIVKRYLNGTPTGDIYYFFESDTGNNDICGGDICIVGSKMWLHTSQLGVTYNVYEIDMSTWTVDNKYAKLGNDGHYPIHACSLAGDNDHIIALYDGGTEGRVIYKINVADYTADWSHTMDATMFAQVDYPFGGLISVGSATLMLISLASNACDEDRETGKWYAIILDVNAGVPHIARNRIIEFSAPILPEIADSVSSNMCELFGWSSIAQTNTGVIAMTGQAQPNKPSSKDVVGSTTPKWASHSGGFSNIGKLHYYLQNGHVINDRDEYTSPSAEKDYCNFSLEQISLNGEILDNGLQDDGSFTATYSGDVKTTGDYEINLRTGEIFFLLPPYSNAEVRASYDFKATIPYFQSEKESRWELIRQIAQANAGVCYVNEKERVVFKLRRNQEDVIIPSTSLFHILKGRNIIHSANASYGIDTIQISNAEHNTFYVQGTDFTIGYTDGVYFITPVGSTITDTHLVVTYLVGPTNDTLPVLDNTGQLRGANIVNLDEDWDVGDMSNSIVIQGKKMNPTETPTVISETFAVSPQSLNMDASFSRVQLAQTNGLYNWNDEKRIFETDDSQNNLNNSGLVLEFSDPMIIGTTAWKIREPDTTHVEEKSTSEAGATAWKKLTWGTPFYETGTDEETSNYDVILTNPNYWRLANLEDTKEDSFKAAAGSDTYKTGAYIYIKKFRGTIAESQNCTAYAYQTKDTDFYVDASGKLNEASITSSTNPVLSASPDKSVEILLEPVTSTNAHLFRTPATYDGVAIGEDYCMSIGTVNIDYNGLTVNLYNYATLENYIKVRVVGYPVMSTANIKATCENRINFDATLSSIETYGEQPMTIENEYIQSLGMGKTIGYSLLDWLKEPHSIIKVTTKFGQDIKLLDPVLVSSSYGNFSETTELWLVIRKSITVEKGENDLSTTVLELIDVPANPSAEPDTSS